MTRTILRGSCSALRRTFARPDLSESHARKIRPWSSALTRSASTCIGCGGTRVLRSRESASCALAAQAAVPALPQMSDVLVEFATGSFARARHWVVRSADWSRRAGCACSCTLPQSVLHGKTMMRRPCWLLSPSAVPRASVRPRPPRFRDRPSQRHGRCRLSPSALPNARQSNRIAFCRSR